MPQTSLLGSIILFIIAGGLIYITFRIVQTLWHLRTIRNSLQEASVKEVNDFLEKEKLTNSIKECCDGAFLWPPLLGAGFNFLASLAIGVGAIAALVNAIRAK